MTKKILSALLAIIMVMSVIPLQVFATETTSVPTFWVDGCYASAGQSVTVEVKVKDNCGIFGAVLTVEYDSKLTLKEASSGEAFSMFVLTPPGQFVSPCNFVWDALATPSTEDGTVLKLTFDVSEDAEPNSKLEIKLSYLEGDITDSNKNPIEPKIENGYVNVIDYIPGDVNGDGFVNPTDISFIRMYRAGGYDNVITSFNQSAADVNDDNRINPTDITWLRQYRAGGYGITLLPHTPRCQHTSLTAVPEKEATCTEDGNIAYWTCDGCNKLFSDAAGTTEISLESTVIEAGHTPATAVRENEVVGTCKVEGRYDEVIYCSVCGTYEISRTEKIGELGNHVPGIPVTENEVAGTCKTEGTYDEVVYCSVCNTHEISRTQKTSGYGDHTYSTSWSMDETYHWHASTCGHTDAVTDKEKHNIVNGSCICSLTYHTIEYYNYKGTDISAMPTVYAENKGVVLPDIYRDGYTFLGWYEQGNPSKRIYAIPADSTKDYVLVADWEAIKYGILYKEAYDFKTEKIETFTVEDEIVLPEPNWSGMEFSHWEDENGTEISTISKGTIGDITVTAKWNSFRNKVTPKTDDRQLVSVKTDGNNKYYFLYEIGTISHVVLEDIVDGQSLDFKSGNYEITLSVSEENEVSENVVASFSNELLTSVSSTNGWGESYTWVDEHSIQTTNSIETHIGATLGEKDIGAINSDLGIKLETTETDSDSLGYTSSNNTTDSIGNEISQSSSTTISFAKSFTGTVEKTITIPANLPVGYYHYARCGNIRVFALAEYNISTMQYNIDTYSVIGNIHTTPLYYRDENDLNDDSCEPLNFTIPFDQIETIVNSSYYVQYNADGGEGEMPVSVHGVGVKSNLLENMYTKDGYYFAGWELRTDSGTTIYQGGASVTDMTTAGNTITLYAHWLPLYKVTYNENKPSNASNDISGMPGPSEWKYDQDSTLAAAPTLTGWTFGGWYKESDCINKVGDGDAKLVKPNLTNIAGKEVPLYAKWTANTITITYDANGGSVSPSTQKKTFDSEYGTMPTPTRAEHKPLGWYTDKNFTTKIDVDTKVTNASDHELCAKWVRTSYTWSAPSGREYTYTENKSGYVPYTESTIGKLDKQALISAGYTGIRVQVVFRMKEKDNCYEYLRILGHEEKYEATDSYETYYFSHDYSLSNSGIDNSCSIPLEFYCYDNDWISDVVYLGDTTVTVTALE